MTDTQQLLRLTGWWFKFQETSHQVVNIVTSLSIRIYFYQAATIIKVFVTSGVLILT